MSPNNLRLFHPRPQLFQAGFTLVEIMVGMVIGMLATLVVMQVFSVFENQKRTTTGTADSLTNGNIALFKIAREIEVVGYGLAPQGNSPLMCMPPVHVDATIPTISGVAHGGVLSGDISPIVITDGGPNGSDTITLRYGGATSGGIPAGIKGTPGGDLSLSSTLGCAVNDIALIMNAAITNTGASCGITYIKAIVEPSAQFVGPTGIIEIKPGTVTVGDVTLGDGNNAPEGGSVACMGTSWHQVTYRTASSGVGAASNLERQDSGDANNQDFLPLVADIVNIQAQYGISATGTSNQVVQWVDATAATGFANPSVADRNRIKAIRIAVVARDAKMEVGNVTKQCDQASNTGLCAWIGTPTSPAPEINLGQADPNWQHYRYRVFETILPLRNVIWSNALL